MQSIESVQAFGVVGAFRLVQLHLRGAVSVAEIAIGEESCFDLVWSSEPPDGIPSAPQRPISCWALQTAAAFLNQREFYSNSALSAAHGRALTSLLSAKGVPFEQSLPQDTSHHAVVERAQHDLFARLALSRLGKYNFPAGTARESNRPMASCEDDDAITMKPAFELDLINAAAHLVREAFEVRTLQSFKQNKPVFRLVDLCSLTTFRWTSASRSVAKRRSCRIRSS